MKNTEKTAVSKKHSFNLGKYKNEYISLAAITAAVTVLLVYVLQLWNMDINVPISYAGGDDFSLLTNAKTMTEQAWNLTADRLGTPYVASYYDFTSSVMHNFDLLTLKIFAMITRDAGSAMNLEYFSVFYLCAFISYFVMHELKIRNVISVCGSVVFAFSSYILMRGTGHFVLTTCYFLPLSVLLCIWVYERDDVFVFNKDFFKNKRNWVAILSIILIANNGIVYYPFFTCYMLGVTAVSKLIKTGKLRYVGKAFSMIAGICVFIGIALLPVLMHILTSGGNSSAIVRGGVQESEMYGLKLVQLFLPVNSHGITPIQNLISAYNDNSMFVNENITSYIGLMGTLGFIILIAFVFVRKRSAFCERMAFLAELNLGLILLGTVGGFGAIVSLVITDKIRGYNRISILIGYVCILGCCLAVNEFYTYYHKKLKKWFLPVFCVFSLFVVWEQNPAGYTPAYDANYAAYMIDDEFVKDIENSVDEGAYIYQLPYHEYPEGGPVNDMQDYHLYTGYIHSDTLNWSYGSMKGSGYDDWNKNVSEMDYPEMVTYLKENGFSGIYIDRRAYTEDEINELEATMTQLTGSERMISRNDHLSFFKFN